MRDFFYRLFSGRRGLDEMSKFFLLCGLAMVLLSGVLAGAGVALLNGLLKNTASVLGFIMIILAAVRSFSRNIPARAAENAVFLAKRDEVKKKTDARKDRFSQRKEYKFYKCPGCGTMIRIARRKGKRGKIHFKCKCGYTLYRRV